MVVGHRGGRGEGWPPENTLAAFERARREGAQAFETDVRLAADEVVLFHDPTLTRMTGKRDRRAVACVPWSLLPAVGLDAQREKVPRLVDLLDWAAQAGCGINVEVKHDVPDRVGLVRTVVRQLGRARVPLLVSSFDPFVLALTRALAPTLSRALLTDPGQSYAPLLQGIARPGLVLGLHVERRQAKADRVASWKRRGLAVGAWTVNEADEARRLVRDGVDVLITDQPGKILRALSG